jgi:hypothetical protein
MTALPLAMVPPNVDEVFNAPMVSVFAALSPASVVLLMPESSPREILVNAPVPLK